MRSLNYPKLIKESEEQLLELERHQNKALLRDRVRFLRLLKNGECPSQAKAGKAIGIQHRQSQQLWYQYRSEGLKGFLTYPYQGRKEKLSEPQKQRLQQELDKDESQSLQQVCQQLEQQSGVHYSVSGMHYVLKRLKVKKKTGRPVHEHRDEKGAKRFKKKAFRL